MATTSLSDSAVLRLPTKEDRYLAIGAENLMGFLNHTRLVEGRLPSLESLAAMGEHFGLDSEQMVKCIRYMKKVHSESLRILGYDLLPVAS